MAGSATLLFGPRYTTDASSIPDSAGTPVFFDSTRVSITKNAGDRFFVSGDSIPDSSWICDDRLYVEDINSGPVGFSGVLNDSLPLCRPIEEVMAPVPARDITSLIPEGTTCVTFRLADTQRQIYGNSAIYLVRTTVSGVTDSPRNSTVRLLPPMPNPARAGVTIAAELPTRTRVRVTVVDLHGRLVRTLASDEAIGPGRWSTSWDGRGRSNSPVPPGIYLVRLTAGSRSLTRRIVIVH